MKTLRMTTDKVVETSANNNKNSPFQDYTNLGDLYLQTCKIPQGSNHLLSNVNRCLQSVL